MRQTLLITVAIDAASTDGKQFSGVLDVSGGTSGSEICGTTCKTASLTITLN